MERIAEQSYELERSVREIVKRMENKIVTKLGMLTTYLLCDQTNRKISSFFV